LPLAANWKELGVAHIRLFKHYIRTPYVILAVLEALAIVGAVYLAVLLRHSMEPFPQNYLTAELLLPAMWVSFVLLCCNLAMSVYAAQLKEGFSGMVVRSLVSFCLLGSVALYLSNLVLPLFSLEPGITSLVITISLLLVLLIRSVFFRLVDAGALRRSVVIIGAGEKARQIWENVCLSSGQRAFELVGFIPCGDEKIRVEPHRVLSLTGSLPDFIMNNGIDEIVVSPDDRRVGFSGVVTMAELLDCKMNGAEVLEAITFCEKELGQIELTLLYPGWLIFSDGFRFNAFRTYIKRGFDLLASGILVLVAWPFMLLAAFAVALESGFRAPVLYRQVRTGQDGKPFELLKFRSMRVDAEKGGAVWARENDDRITRVGGFIRSTRLDELPQIYNILKGDMSFIGPRPERPEFVADLVEQIPYYDERHRVKPGLMGWAQLCYPYGASIEDAAQKLRYDLYYIKNHSILLDLMIVVQTVEVVLVGNGAR
jgi:sugar transferase (PEP-CTERM system associated)